MNGRRFLLGSFGVLLCAAVPGLAQSLSGSNPSDVPIPDAAGSSQSSIHLGAVPSGATITGVDVSFRIVHTFSADLQVRLCTTVFGGDFPFDVCHVLWDHEGGSSDDPTRTTSGLDDFDGLSAEQGWFLVAEDAFEGDIGYIDEWSITVHYTAPGPGSFTLESGETSCQGGTSPVPAVQLGWTASFGASSYEVYRDGGLLASGVLDTSFYDDAALVAGETYGYTVRAVNESGSYDSNTLVVSLPGDLCDTLEPPGPFTLTSQPPLCEITANPQRPAVRLQWTASVDAEVYEVHRNGLLVATGVVGTSYLDTGAAAGQTHGYLIRARNAAGTRDSNLLQVEILDSICTPVDYHLGPEVAPVPAVVEPEAPRVVYGRDGQRAMIWFQLGAGGSIVCIQLFDADGTQRTAPLRVDQTPGVNRTPSASFDSEGNLYVFWTRDDGAAAVDPTGRVISGAGQGAAVLGRRFDKNGAPLGGESAIAGGGGESAAPEASADRSGRTVVAWNDGGWIRARQLDPDGRTMGPLITANLYPGGSDPRVAISGSGEFVLVWREQLGEPSGILLRRYDDTGAAASEVRVATSSSSAQHPAIGMDDAGNFTIAWDDFGETGRDVFAQRYFPNTTARGARYRVNALAEGDQTRPRVAINGKGKAAIVWESTEADDGVGVGGSVRGRTYDSSGSPEAGELEIAAAGGGNEPRAPDVSLDEEDDLAVVYERRGPGNRPEGVFRREVEATAPAAACTAAADSLCLNQERFLVTALWEDAATRDAFPAQAVELTGDTGYFWFFDPDNVEVVVKVLDACSINGRYWVFAAGLTNVEVSLRVDDLATGSSVTYFNKRDQAFLPILDVDGFAGCGEPASAALSAQSVDALGERHLRSLAALLDDLTSPPSATTNQAQDAACSTEGESLCVAGERFRVEVDFTTASGATGRGQAFPLTSDTGYFWFFDPDNVEIVVKVLDACGLNDRYWVFAAGLTNVEARLTVTDTLAGVEQVYENAQGMPFQPLQDTSAFSTCP